MPYNPNIPQPNDIISQSQPQLLGNFQEINTLIAVNHATFGTPNEGKHNIVTLPENAAPTPTLIDEASIYSQLSALTNQTELAWQRENNGPVIEWTSFLGAGTGWTRFPSGILIKWGGASLTGFNQPIVYPVVANTPVFTAAYVTFVTPRVGSASTDLCTTVLGSQTVLGFSVNCFGLNGLGTNVPLSYVTIGR
jgi:hypothetical protein